MPDTISDDISYEDDEFLLKEKPSISQFKDARISNKKSKLLNNESSHGLLDNFEFHDKPDNKPKDLSLPLIADRITPLNHLDKKAKNRMNDTFGSKVSFDEAKHGY